MSTDRTEALNYALATWVFLLHVDGVQSADSDIAAGCRAVQEAEDESTGNAAGEKLVAHIGQALQGSDLEGVASFARKLYGDRVDTGLGQGDRTERLSRIRKYQFSSNLPWLARIWERDEQGQVAPTWLVVERVTDEVAAMDPNPWNDIDENRRIPVGDFQVLWELDACAAVAVA